MKKLINSVILFFSLFTLQNLPAQDLLIRTSIDFTNNSNLDYNPGFSLGVNYIQKVNEPISFDFAVALRTVSLVDKNPNSEYENYEITNYSVSVPIKLRFSFPLHDDIAFFMGFGTFVSFDLYQTWEYSDTDGFSLYYDEGTGFLYLDPAARLDLGIASEVGIEFYKFYLSFMFDQSFNSDYIRASSENSALKVSLAYRIL